jgi:phosphoglycerate dehydrogenase-like enzyme
VRAGAWNIGQAEPMQRTATLCFGLVGYGRIARALHRKIVALGARDVLIVRPAARGDAPWHAEARPRAPSWSTSPRSRSAPT